MRYWRLLLLTLAILCLTVPVTGYAQQICLGRTCAEVTVLAPATQVYVSAQKSPTQTTTTTKAPSPRQTTTRGAPQKTTTKGNPTPTQTTTTKGNPTPTQTTMTNKTPTQKTPTGGWMDRERRVTLNWSRRVEREGPFPEGGGPKLFRFLFGRRLD